MWISKAQISTNWHILANQSSKLQWRQQWHDCCAIHKIEFPLFIIKIRATRKYWSAIRRHEFRYRLSLTIFRAFQSVIGDLTVTFCLSININELFYTLARICRLCQIREKWPWFYLHKNYFSFFFLWKISLLYVYSTQPSVTVYKKKIHIDLISLLSVTMHMLRIFH